jgi:hypothetical protein
VASGTEARFVRLTRAPNTPSVARAFALCGQSTADWRSAGHGSRLVRGVQVPTRRPSCFSSGTRSPSSVATGSSSKRTSSTSGPGARSRRCPRSSRGCSAISNSCPMAAGAARRSTPSSPTSGRLPRNVCNSESERLCGADRCEAMRTSSGPRSM